MRYDYVYQNKYWRVLIQFNMVLEYVEKIHAISIVAKTVEQWKQSKDYIPSPDCAHN